MSRVSDTMTCGACQPCGPCGGKGLSTLKDGAWTNNPINVQVLGVCSALAVTNRLENALVMGVALTFVCVMSNLLVSLLRGVIPRRTRMIAEMAIIATFVILFNEVLKAYYFTMSQQLGAYVGLIITNCIIMGRAEAFALQNRPLVSVVDGLANGLGYAAVLGIVGFIRELLGSWSILGHRVGPEWLPDNLWITSASGAFIVLGFLIAGFNAFSRANEREGTT